MSASDRDEVTSGFASSDAGPLRRSKALAAAGLTKSVDGCW
ncbi:MAG: hypothetical protein QM820_56905 [Minicystis sp.]